MPSPSQKVTVVAFVLLVCLLTACAAAPTPGAASATPPGSPTPAARSAAPSAPAPSPSITLTGHTSAVTRLSWSPDGALLASSAGGFSSDDDTIRVWHADGTLAYVLTGHTQPVTGLAWSPDGTTLASSSLDETIRLWSRAGQPQAARQSGAGRVFAVAWSPKGDLLASSSIVTFTHPTVQLWTPAGQVSATLSTAFSGGKFYNLAWSPDGQYLLGGATDYKLWRAGGTEIFWLKACERCTPAWGMAWSPDSTRWAVGDESGNIEIYTSAGTKVASVHDETSVNSLAWSPDSTRLASARTLWRADGTKLAALNLPPGVYANSLAWSPDGRFLASGGSDKVVHLFAPDGRALSGLAGHTAPINALAWSPAGSVLASASDDQTIRLWTIK